MISKVPESRLKAEVIIDNPERFTEWRKSVRRISAGNKPSKFVFRLGSFSEAENEDISQQVNFYHGECGCNSGSFFMTFMLLASVATYFITGGRFLTIGLADVARLIGILLLSAIAGKIFGLLKARWRLIKLSDNIQEKLAEHHPDKSFITNH